MTNKWGVEIGERVVISNPDGYTKSIYNIKAGHVGKVLYWDEHFIHVYNPEWENLDRFTDIGELKSCLIGDKEYEVLK